jgi:hypothetical protein
MNTQLQAAAISKSTPSEPEKRPRRPFYQLKFEEILDLHFRIRSTTFSSRHTINLTLSAPSEQLAGKWPDQTICSSSTGWEDGRISLGQVVIEVSPTCLVQANSRYRERGSDVLILAATIDEARSVYALLLREFGASGHEIAPGVPVFRVLALDDKIITTHRIPLVGFPEFGPGEMELNYGPKFPDWASKLQGVIQQKASSLTVLQGPPGTGKTTFLRWLIAQSGENADFYYLPATCIELLSNPSMTDFWLRECRNSPLPKVLIIEDAEMLLLKRGAENSNWVGNLLNITDGILGDALRFHIICSINCPFSEIDPALLRTGRLAASWVFKPLQPDQAVQLASKLGRACPDPRASITLADIYASEPLGQIQAQKVIGFHSSDMLTEI